MRIEELAELILNLTKSGYVGQDTLIDERDITQVIRLSAAALREVRKLKVPKGVSPELVVQNNIVSIPSPYNGSDVKSVVLLNKQKERLNEVVILTDPAKQAIAPPSLMTRASIEGSRITLVNANAEYVTLVYKSDKGEDTELSDELARYVLDDILGIKVFAPQGLDNTSDRNNTEDSLREQINNLLKK